MADFSLSSRDARRRFGQFRKAPGGQLYVPQNYEAAQTRDLAVLPGHGGAEIDRKETYNLLLSYYDSRVFSSLTSWWRYRQSYGLYKYIRPIFNPVRRVVDFYVSVVYPGLIGDYRDLPEGLNIGIPLHPQMEDETINALFTLWEWADWQSQQALMIFYAALTGNCLIEVIDDVTEGKVSYEIYWPGQVAGIRLDRYGQLEEYLLEYDVADPRTEQTYRYQKLMTKDVITEFHDDRVVAQYANPYPFVPAVWVKHEEKGNDYGSPAITDLTKIDEINSLASHISDHVHKKIRSPRIIFAEGHVTSLFDESEMTNEGAFDERTEVPMLKAHQGGSTETLVGDLEAGAALPLMDKLLEEIGSDYSEIVLFQKLREQSVVTGPGAKTLVGDVLRKVARPAANYDRASQRLFRMGLAIAGWRANSGAWGRLTREQALFEPFDLDTYTDDTLLLKILPREIIPESGKDVADELSIRAQAVASIGDVLPIEEKLALLGYRAEQIPEIVTRLNAQKEIEREQAIEMQQAVHAMKADSAELDTPSVPAKKPVNAKQHGTSDGSVRRKKGVSNNAGSKRVNKATDLGIF